MMSKQKRLYQRPLAERCPGVTAVCRGEQPGGAAPLAASRAQCLVQLGVACAVLALGGSVYLLDRANSGAWLVPEWWSMAYTGAPVFGRLGQHLPTFVHVYAFILITAAALAPSRQVTAIICLSWLAVDSLFELAQIESIAAFIGSHVPSWFFEWPLLENIASYFMAGRFDIYDLCSILLGSVAAFLTVRLTMRHGDDSC